MQESRRLARSAGRQTLAGNASDRSASGRRRGRHWLWLLPPSPDSLRTLLSAARVIHHLFTLACRTLLTLLLLCCAQVPKAHCAAGSIARNSDFLWCIFPKKHLHVLMHVASLPGSVASNISLIGILKECAPSCNDIQLRHV